MPAMLPHARRFTRPPFSAIARNAWMTVALGVFGPVILAADHDTAPPSIPLTIDAGQEREIAGRRDRDGEAPAGSARGMGWLAWATVAIAAAAAIVARRLARRTVAALPADVLELLGTTPLGPTQTLRVIRFGTQTLLVSTTPSGSNTLAVVDDPEVSAAMAAACRTSPPLAQPRRWPLAAALLLATPLMTAVSAAEPGSSIDPAPPPLIAASQEPAVESSTMPTSWLERILAGRSLDGLVSIAITFGVVSIAPAILLMTTCFVRMSVVLAMARQGFGGPQLPSNQVLTSLALFLSALVMWPIWTAAYRDGIEPYQAGQISFSTACERTSLPIRRWMATQIEQAGNRDTMLLFLERHPSGRRDVTSYDDVPIESLLPAFLVSELKAAFTIGFRILLPFLVLDCIVATLVLSTGLVMLPPTLVSLPLKILVFVLADGWSLVVQSLLDSVQLGMP
jgi:flagellar biosynthetic protein FliP